MVPAALMNLKEIMDSDQLGIFGTVAKRPFHIIAECVVIFDSFIDAADAAAFSQIDAPEASAVSVADLIHQIDFLMVCQFSLRHFDTSLSLSA
jgi:hypothetical protein